MREEVFMVRKGEAQQKGLLVRTSAAESEGIAFESGRVLLSFGKLIPIGGGATNVVRPP